MAFSNYELEWTESREAYEVPRPRSRALRGRDDTHNLHHGSVVTQESGLAHEALTVMASVEP
jgi:hypothetical protein